MEYGITTQGFIRKPYNVILQDLQIKAQSPDIFGADIDLSSYSPVGMFIELMSYAIDRQWSLAEELYYSLWPSTASGVNLDRTVKIGMVTRKPASKAIAHLIFKGSIGTIIASGTQVETATGIIFETVSDSVVNNDGTSSVYSTAIIVGPSGNVPAHSITNIKTPISGIDTVDNLAAAYGGREIETDSELRERYQTLPSATGSSIDAIKYSILNMTDASYAVVYENITNEVDSNNLPAKSIEAVVVGGDNNDIAEIIFKKKPAGIDSFGNIITTIIDSQGLSHIIKFSRPELVDVYVSLNLITNADWDDSSIVQIKRSIIEYIGGTTDQSKECEGVGIAGTIYAWKLSGLLNNISGISNIKSCYLGKSPNPNLFENLKFMNRELPRIDNMKITVSVE